MAIPESFTEEYLKKAEGCTLFGIKLTDLSRDELIAAVVAGWEKEVAEREEHFRQLKFIKSLRRGLNNS